MSLNSTGFREYYSPSGVLLEKDIPQVLLSPLKEEESVLRVFPNPQLHIREGIRGFWIRKCFECGKKVYTVINPTTPTDNPFSKVDNDPYSKASLKKLWSKQEKICCPECEATT